MKASLRLRFFGWLAALLFIFILVQAIIYAIVELATMAHVPGLSAHDQLMEVLVGVGMDLFLFPVLLIPAWWISRRMIRPIHAISETATDIGCGNFEKRIDTSLMPDDETLALANCINGAFDRYRDAVDRLDRFIGDAAHQLRTPLAAIRTSGEVVLATPHSEKDYEETIADILQSVARLSRLVEQLLKLARLRSEELTRHFNRVDLGAIARRSCDIYRALCDDRGIELDCTSTGNHLVMGNDDLLQELLGNLLENAAKHAPEKGRIAVSLTHDGETSVLKVCDTGPGVPPEEAQHIFARFHRSNSTTTGSGLGLALVAEIARVHGGTAALSPEPEWGAVFVVHLPHIPPA